MKIKYWMTPNPITIGPDAPIAEAARLMKEQGFRRLPVMEGDRLVGLVTYRNILEAQPSPVSTLSKQEARYLVAKLKVSDVMHKNPVTVSPDDDVLSALMEGNRRGLGSYPVVSDGRLVGIITATDLFNLVVHILGADDRSDFIYLSETNTNFSQPDYLAKLIGLLSEQKISLLNFMSFPRKESPEVSVVFLKVSPGCRPQAVDILTRNGFVILK